MGNDEDQRIIDANRARLMAANKPSAATQDSVAIKSVDGQKKHIGSNKAMCFSKKD